MPIYANYKSDKEEFEILGIRHNINGKDFKYIMALRKMIENARDNFLYKSESNFCSSISREVGWNTNLANFDISRCKGRVDEARYISMMREFIVQCNTELAKNTNIRFVNARFDILGGWTRGEIVLLIPKNKRGWK